MRNFLPLCLLSLCLVVPVAQAEFDSGVFEFQKKLADKGEAPAQFKLGNMYETGRGVAMDLYAATTWYEKAAANNYKPAKNRLVFLQIKKSGFKPEHQAWLEELRKDSASGDGEAMMILGEMYERGTGVSRNLVEAQSEYKRASVKGIPGSENAYYAVSALLDKQKKDQEEEEKRMAAEKARQSAEAEREAQRKKQAQEEERQRQAQVKLEAEKKRLEEERLRLQAERLKLEEMKRQQVEPSKPAEPVAKSAPVAAESAKEEPVFESDTCSGKAARFRATCQ